MTLHVTTESFISDVQEQFRNHFPDFKLEFFFSASEKIIPSNHLHHSFPFVRIRELNTLCRKSTLEIKDTMTVSELEKKFRRKFGLPARIYKKVGEYWQKKASFDKCTLNNSSEIKNSLYFIHARSQRIAPEFSMGG